MVRILGVEAFTVDAPCFEARRCGIDGRVHEGVDVRVVGRRPVVCEPYRLRRVDACGVRLFRSLSVFCYGILSLANP
jgi:hypothetical protein